MTSRPEHGVKLLIHPYGATPMTDTLVMEDPTMLAGLFSRAAEAIVQASTLPGRVRELEEQVKALQEQLNASRLHSEELDRTLAEVRHERDQARQERDIANADVSRMQDELSEERRINEAQALSHQHNMADTAETIKGLKELLNTSRRAHDDAEYKVIDLEERLKAAEAKLTNIKAHMSGMFGLSEVSPKPEPVSEAAIVDHVVGF